MIEEPKLDPCPFCGHEEVKFSRYNGSLYCYCMGCGSRGINAHVLTSSHCDCHPDEDRNCKNTKIIGDALIKVAEAWNKRS